MLKKFLSMLLPKKILLVDACGVSDKVFLTFDDGPHTNITPQLLDLLDQFDISAVFFCIGSNLEEHYALAKELVKRGHTIGNHSYFHQQFSKQSLVAQISEIKKANKLIADISPQQSVIPFRAPQGRWTPLLMLWLIYSRIPAVHWSVDSLDSRALPADEIEEHLLSRVQGGDVVLLHDDNKLCCDVLETLLPKWQAQGFEFGNLISLWK
ncbi:MAG: polysaccharide deacetylase family protein [Pseudomonadales bacterium]|nr:polysaccharide deacetylase family protein [Pseudomonadales bacterium]